MKLSERIKQNRVTRPTETPNSSTRMAAEQPERGVAEDALSRLKQQVSEALLLRMGPSLFDATISPAQLSQGVVQELGRLVEQLKIPLTVAERDNLVRTITDQMLGYGPLEPYLKDPTITEIMVNGLHGIYVERQGQLVLTDGAFLSEPHILRVIDRIVASVGRRIDEASPMVDARLADGSRVNAIIAPLAIDGPQLTIRKFAQQTMTLDDLVRLNTLTREVGTFLSACVRGRINILISGGTGSGKTTLLNVLSSLIPDGERIVTIEDAAELRLSQRHVVRLESRPANIEGKGAIRARELVNNALRMRPDRIVLGEVRGAETLDMLQAMNTGHDGSLSTLHANSPRDALARVETMVLMSGFDLPLRAIREQTASSIDLIVQIARMRDGARRVTKLCAVEGMEGDVVTLSDLFVFDYASSQSDHGEVHGSLRPTGVRPKLAERLSQVGIELPGDLFGPR
jgi:pilus assembly protein CpaF